MARISDAQATLGWRIFTWIGIIDQLATTRASRTLAELKLPFPQFVMLNHFSHRPGEAKTVTAIATALQQPQPGITKTIQKMIARKLLKAQSAPDDARSKLISITSKGIEVHAQAVTAFVPLLAEIYRGWDETEMTDLFAKLDRLKVWMDTKGRE